MQTKDCEVFISHGRSLKTSWFSSLPTGQAHTDVLYFF